MRQLLVVFFACLCMSFQFSNEPSKSFIPANGKMLPDTIKKHEIVKGIITGEATGPAKSLANLFRISLYGSNSKKKFITSKPFNWEGTYTFDNLPEGKYWVVIENNSNTSVKVTPKKRVLEVKNGQILELDFTFK